MCYDAVLRLAQFSNQNDRLFCLNLSALFLTEFYKKEFLQILPYVDILFGNDQVSRYFMCILKFNYLIMLHFYIKGSHSFCKKHSKCTGNLKNVEIYF